MKDGGNENLSSFWLDSDDEKCEDNLMVTKSLVIKSGKILNSSCKEKYEDYECWREYKGVLLNLYKIRNSWTLMLRSIPEKKTVEVLLVQPLIRTVELWLDLNWSF